MGHRIVDTAEKAGLFKNRLPVGAVPPCLWPPAIPVVVLDVHLERENGLHGIVHHVRHPAHRLKVRGRQPLILLQVRHGSIGNSVGRTDTVIDEHQQ